MPFMRVTTAFFIAFLAAGPLYAAKQTLTLGIVLEPPALDPTAGAAAAIDEVVYANVFEGLTRLDETGAVKPALARSWTISEDGAVYTFFLQENVTFHDGASFTADDVVFSLNRARADDSTNAQKALFSPIKAVEAADPLTVVITLHRPYGDFLFNLAWGDAVIVAAESARTNASRPIGTGPYRFSKWVRASHIELVAYEDYWGKKPAIKQAIFKFIPDPAAALAAFLAGDVDGFDNFPAPENLPQLEADPRFSVVIGSTEGETLLALNHARPEFSDIRVRKAMAHAIDKEAVLEGAMFGYGTLIGSHFAPHHPAYVDLSALYPYDLEKARQLMREAGFETGFKVSLKLPPPSYARRGGQIIAAQLAQIGIEVELIPLEWAGWLEQVFHNKDYDMTVISHTEPMDIGIYAREDYYFNYFDPAFNQIMEALEQTSAPEQRYALLEQAQRHLAVNATNIFLFQLAKHGVWDKRLRGLWRNSPIQANDLTKAYWAE